METDFEKGIGAPVGEGRPASPISESNAALDIIRTETVLSKLPRHILSKSGKRPEIRIEKFTTEGKLDLKWIVSFNELYGPARQLAYDLDTLIVERAIEETFEEARRAGQSLPRLIPIGSLRDLCRKLNLEENGTNAAKIKHALQQNAGAVINTFLSYRGNDGTEFSIDGTFTCYGVFLTGRKLPDGRKAEQTYISTTNEYHQVISTAPTRPLDYSYKLQLPPTPRRLYEILSFPMYGALKNYQPFAKLLYSDYCTRAPHVRYSTFDQVKKQMYTVNKPHKKSGYIISVKYEFLIDAKGNPDWMMLYTPGPKARAEFSAAHRGRKISSIDVQSVETSERESRRRSVPRQRRLKFESVPQTIQVTMPNVTIQPSPEVAIDPEILSALTSRGIIETTARELLSNLKPNQNILDQIEWGEHQIAVNPGKFTNPAGFLITFIRENITVPATFETSRQRKVREEEERHQRLEREHREQLEREYATYTKTERERYLQSHLDPAEFIVVKQARAKQLREQYLNLTPDMVETLAESAARKEIGERASILSFEEFSAQRKLKKTASEMAGQQSGEPAITPILLLSPPAEPGR